MLLSFHNISVMLCKKKLKHSNSERNVCGFISKWFCFVLFGGLVLSYKIIKMSTYPNYFEFKMSLSSDFIRMYVQLDSGSLHGKVFCKTVRIAQDFPMFPKEQENYNHSFGWKIDTLIHHKLH